MCFLNIGEFHLKMKNWENAKLYLENCLKLNKKLNSVDSSPLSNINKLDCKIGQAFALS